MKPVRVLLADDHALVRAGLRLLVDGLEGVQVVAEAQDGREALDLIKLHRPDLVLMDIGMKELNGFEATAHVKKEFPDVHVVILSMHASEEHVLQGLRAGASGYLLKDSATPELEQAIRSVTRGEVYLSAPLSQHVIMDYVQRVSEGRTPADLLTSRQREILQLIAEGNNTKEIAHRLDVSVKTVEAHRAQLMERLDIHDVAGLVRAAIRMGLITSEE